MTVLATDLDRTLIPNGRVPYNGNLQSFYKKIDAADITLWYVTGRNLAEFESAKSTYGLRDPAYLCAEVGTVIYERSANGLQPLDAWRTHITEQNPLWNRDNLVPLLSLNSDNGVRLQEPEHQNEFKISLYLDDHNQKEAVLEHVRKEFAEIGLEPELIWSFDPLKNDVGLLDIQPAGATKLGALRFLAQYTNIELSDLTYAGDSGNDLLPLTSGANAIVVNNAPAELKSEVCERAEAGGFSDAIYIAENGNYADAILEGLRAFGVINHDEE